MRLLVRHIIAHVAAHYGVTVDDITKQDRHERFLWPRQIAAYLAYELTGLSRGRLGLSFKRDQATLFSSIQKVRTRAKRDLPFMLDLEILRSELELLRLQNHVESLLVRVEANAKQVQAR